MGGKHQHLKMRQGKENLVSGGSLLSCCLKIQVIKEYVQCDPSLVDKQVYMNRKKTVQIYTRLLIKVLAQ